MNSFPARAPVDLCLQFTMNQAQAANTYDLCTASGGDVIVWGISLYCTVAGTNWTSTTLQTDATTNFVVMDATQGARANFTAGKDIAITWTQVQKIMIRSGNKLRYTIAGTTGVGTTIVTVLAQAIGGATLV